MSITTKLPLAAALCVALAGRAAADPDPDPDAAPGDKGAKADDKADKEDEGGPDIDVSGRIFARATAYEDEVNDNQWFAGFSVPSARVGVRYRWKDRVEAKVSFEAKGSLRDAYVDVSLTPCVHLVAGRFKLPASAIERTSSWTLPTIDRPIGSDVLSDGLGVVGRHSGVQLTYDYAAGVHPKLEVSLAQAYNDVGDDAPGLLSDGASVTATVRGEIKPAGGVHLGAFGQSREVTHSRGVGRYWTGGLDLEAEHGGLRLWADAIAGTSHFGLVPVVQPLEGDDRPFVIGQAIAAWRQGGRKTGKRYVEPYLAAAYINPSTERKHDQVTQFVAGVGGGRWKKWRVQLQAALQEAGYKHPATLGGVSATDVFDDRVTVTAQVGTAF